jgi:hypothetical protein
LNIFCYQVFISQEESQTALKDAVCVNSPICLFAETWIGPVSRLADRTYLIDFEELPTAPFPFLFTPPAFFPGGHNWKESINGKEPVSREFT